MSKTKFFIGTYSDAGQAVGIYTCELDDSTGELSEISAADDRYNPTYLALSSDGRYVYAADEVDDRALISAWRIGAMGELSFINRIELPGGGLCNINMGAGDRYVIAANYQGGNVVTAGVENDGRLLGLISDDLHSGASVNPERQTKPYAHCAIMCPDGIYAVACDLGVDKLYLYRALPGGALEPHIAVDVPPGEGPRHIIFDASGQRAYVITELMSRVLTFDYKDGRFELLQSVDALPISAEGDFSGADIQLTPDGLMLFASVRDAPGGGADVVAMYKVLHDGRLAPDGHIGVGSVPRNLAVSLSGKWLLVGCQSGNVVQVFDVESRELAHELTIPSPVCIKFLR